MIKVKVPATSANLGPGFDAFGLALSIYNTFSFQEKDDGKLTIRGVDRRYQGDSNLVYVSMQKVFKRVGHHPKGLYIHSEVDIPISRGLGSSATCIVAGLFGANALLGSPLSKEVLFDMAVELEGHPDNVAPAIFGGLVVSTNEHGKNIYIKNKVHPCFGFFALVPNFPLSTSDARNVLPETIRFRDATFNLARSTMCYLALCDGYEDILKHCMTDRLHQPYRQKLIANYSLVTKKALELGALNTCISGAGPTILAINSVHNKDFQPGMIDFFAKKNLPWQVIPLYPDDLGVKIFGG